MRQGGKNRLPTALKVLRGNPGGRPLNSHEPASSGPIGEAPLYFTDDQRAVWNELIDAAPPNVWTASDRFVLEVAVRNLLLFRNTEIQTSHQSAELRRSLSELGLSPSERSRMVAKKPEEQNPFLNLLKP